MSVPQAASLWMLSSSRHSIRTKLRPENFLRSNDTNCAERAEETNLARGLRGLIPPTNPAPAGERPVPPQPTPALAEFVRRKKRHWRATDSRSCKSKCERLPTSLSDD